MINYYLKKDLILASGSPRRKELMLTLGLPFRVEVSEEPEHFPDNLTPALVPALLSERKALAILKKNSDCLVLSADTVVIADGMILNKPLDRSEAAQMLHMLSGKAHEVVTAFSLFSADRRETVSDIARVVFKALHPDEINYYLDHGRPFDKAGAYGIQEWIGLVAVERIEGSYFTVMGLPTHLVWNRLMESYLQNVLNQA